MPEINSIPYESAEDLNKYLYDEYYSTEQLEEVNTLTGVVYSNIFELEQNTGVTQNSTSMTYYDLNYFNPLYGEAVWKCYLNSQDNVKVFFGFKETTAAPIFPSEGPMVESHAGYILDWENGVRHLYASVANGYSQQKVEIYGIDMTHVENYKIAYNKFSIMPLPVIEEQLGLPTVYSVDRKWKEMVTLNGTDLFHIGGGGLPYANIGENNYAPLNKVHYIVQFIKNITGAEKYIRFNRFIYKEVYAD